MAQFKFSKLDTTTQGIILFTLGVVLLLYTLNIFTAWFNAILIISAFAMLVIGAIKLELPERLKKLFKKR
ncbi:MAG TPA: hypothetical protein VHO47_04600 [Candidatus Babeliales bacterium]|nr:hypothetical protein [Candidatus Babeliales bacterium]